MPTAKDYEIGAMEAHDAAGFETDMIQPADWGRLYGDGYGNNVAHGDLSVQRMRERGARSPWNTTAAGDDDYGQATPPNGYDDHPWMLNSVQMARRAEGRPMLAGTAWGQRRGRAGAGARFGGGRRWGGPGGGTVGGMGR